MRRALRTHLPDVLWIALVVALAGGVGAYVLAHQRFTLPDWSPGAPDTVDFHVDLRTAKSVAPGQGQGVTIAGVRVGEISDVRLVDGHARITLRIRRRHADVHRDATVLLRPRTGLEDMIAELDPGTPTAPRVPDGGTIGIQRTASPVQVDEILAALDRDTRESFVQLLGGAGEAVRDNDRALSATLRRLEPTARDLRRVGEQVALRRRNVRRAVHSFSRLAAAVGRHDSDLERLVRESDQALSSLARQDAGLAATLRRLPATLDETRTTLTDLDALAVRLGRALGGLRPAARALAPALRATRPLLTATRPVVARQLRPFARRALPTVRVLRPAAADLAIATPALGRATGVLERALNALAYDPPGADRSFLFWSAWANHNTASLFSTQDAHGPMRRGIVVTSCDSLGVLETLKATNPQLGTITELANVPDERAVCPAAQAAAARLEEHR